MSPSQKVGIERATIAPSVIAWSKIEYWRTALTIPVVRPRTTATVNALSISTSVAGIRSAITSRTTRPSRYERPQLAVTRPPTGGARTATDVERLVETELPREPLHVLGAHRRAHRVDRDGPPGRQMQYGEPAERDQHEHDERLDDPSREIRAHRRPALRSCPRSHVSDPAARPRGACDRGRRGPFPSGSAPVGRNP